jgi:diaminopimelate decarboxylase
MTSERRQINQFLSIRQDRLFLENCDLTEIAKQFGTPLFVISESHLRSNLRRYKNAFTKYWHEGPVRIMPSLKASPLLAIRKVLSDEGCGCDIFGPGELECALRGGVNPSEISVNGSIKDREIIRRGIDIGARIVLDSPRELEMCEEEGRALNKIARVMFRIKPVLSNVGVMSDFAPDYEIRDLTQLIKYGIPTAELLPMCTRVMQLDHVEPIGIHVHIGRHSSQLEVWESLVTQTVLLTKQMSELMSGWIPSEVDFGGGFPSFPNTDPDVYVKGYSEHQIEDYAKVIVTTFRHTMATVNLDCAGITLEVEPGRGLHCDTGVHLTSVKNIKQEDGERARKWAEVDTSEVFLGVPGLSEEDPFAVMVANKTDQPNSIITDIVGLTCNAERLCNQIETPVLDCGDVLALLNTGSYIEAMAANFNALPRPGSVLVSDTVAELVKRHETIDDVLARDIIPERLK